MAQTTFLGKWFHRGLYPWRGIDWLLLFFPICITLFSSLLIASTRLYTSETDLAWNHVVMCAFGVAICMWIARSRYESLLDWRWVIYLITNASLVAVMLIGTVGNGAQSWISIGGFNIQPSEFAKIGIIITLAATLKDRESTTLGGLLKALAITAVPWVLIFLQPDLGTSLVFGAIVLGMLYWSNMNPGWLVLLVSPIVAAIIFNLYIPVWIGWVILMAVIAWMTLPLRWYSTLIIVVINSIAGKIGELLWDLLQDYQRDRLTLFLNPEQDPLGGGYHLIQSRIAIGSGQLWGRGLFHGTQTQLSFIPEQHTDFIFSALGEELGFMGALAMVLAFWFICLRLIIIAQNAKDNFGSLLAIGVLSMIVFQVVINIGMTIGLAPITGIPLPWMSYGRSSLLTNFIGIGIVESVANFQQRMKF
ncbi:MAG: rod shape-determining protein RodA [Leptolyngbyaceae cyanobacterium MAG.088]|nr:rod shape-determining protein RodA [Leptolyngbyaceae cyanobacterium MAG.088]